MFLRVEIKRTRRGSSTIRELNKALVTAVRIKIFKERRMILDLPPDSCLDQDKITLQMGNVKKMIDGRNSPNHESIITNCRSYQ